MSVAMFRSIWSIVLHPVAFIVNLYRTITIANRKHLTFTVEREHDGYIVQMRKPLSPEGPFVPGLPIVPYPGFKPHSRILPKGSKRKEYNLPLPCDILLEKDFTFPMRDGIKLYGDIYRPVSRQKGDVQEKVPVVLTWAPYGKEGNSEKFHDRLPERLGIRREMYSGYEAWEGPDPAYWCARGYAVVQVDSRGAWNSEGNMYFWGKQDENDGYDAIEFLADLSWCNGKIGMAGNSWLAITQWFIASARPPHLAAIAPWEGATDAYRDQGRRGGMPDSTMSHAVGLMTPGRQLQEDQGRMIDTHELWDHYWEDKRSKVGKITCPIYALASYSSKLHGQGTFRGWREAGSREKWIRVHPHFEWYDWWHNQDDLLLFYDHYLKGKSNSWTSTPKVRLSILGFSSVEDIVNRPLTTYPPPSMALETYYLNNKSNTASITKSSQQSSAAYPAADMASEVTFDIIFDEYTEIAGYAKLSLWLQCHDHDDMDVYVLLSKIDKHGNPLSRINFPHQTPKDELPQTNVVRYLGPTGFLRASHRDFSARGPSYAEPIQSGDQGSGSEWSGQTELWHPHFQSKKVPRGEIVNLQFTTWPMGVAYEKGEGMRVRISGHDMSLVEALELPVNLTKNVGTHILHTGGKYDSNIMLPILRK